MNQCSFLTTKREKVECFKGCAFYNYEETNGECPFKDLTRYNKENVKNLYDNFYIEEDDDIFMFEGELERVEL